MKNYSLFAEPYCVEKRERNSMKYLVIIAACATFMFSGCAYNYHIQTFSNNVESLSRIEKKIGENGEEVAGIRYEGVFTASDYESAIAQAKNAGYTKVLSIEYGTNRYILGIGTKWVTIRCAK